MRNLSLKTLNDVLRLQIPDVVRKLNAFKRFMNTRLNLRVSYPPFILKHGLHQICINLLMLYAISPILCITYIM